VNTSNAVIGIPVFENVAHLRPALESILAQDHPAFAIVVVDDSRTDEPEEIVRAYEGVHYERNPARLGLAANWRRTLARARELHPEARYFAWGSDHDLWEPGWLTALSREFDRHPEAVLAYPLNDVVDAAGAQVAEPWAFDTRGRGAAARFRQTLRRMVAGDMVYGLFRVDALARCGALRDVTYPDRLLLAELSLDGEFRQVPQLLWHRRRLAAAVPADDRTWWVEHARVLARSRGVVPAAAYGALAPAYALGRRAYYAAGGGSRQARPAPAVDAEPAEQTGVDVVIVSYRSRDLLPACLESLRAHPPRVPLRVHVVDNASGDGTVELVREQFPEVDLTASDRNLGFAAASNIGIRKGRSPFVLLLNPDTEVTEGALDRLLDVMAERPEVGICGCRLLRPDGTFDHAARRSFPTVTGALGHFTGLGRRNGAPARLAQYRAPDVEAGPVDAVNGAFMLIRRSALAEVGLFDEGYWMYMEDLDLCYRFAEAGWVTWYEPSVTVVHVKGASSGGRRDPRLNIAFHSGMLRFYRAHYAPRRNPVANVAVYGGIAGKLGLSLARNAVRR
jgi:N-acetylglucosaminyl-diphospho-decaprenol L-rhamnosyltransferase